MCPRIPSINCIAFPRGRLVSNFGKFAWDRGLSGVLGKTRRVLNRCKLKYVSIYTRLRCVLYSRYSVMISLLTHHYIDVIMTTMASQITSLTVVDSTVYSDADQRKHQSSAPLAFVWGIHGGRWIPHTKGQLRVKCFHLMTSSCVRYKPILFWFASLTLG